MNIEPKRPGRRLIKVGQVAEKVGKCVSSVWADVAAGILPKPVKVGGATRWVEDEIDAHIDRLLAERDSEAA